MLNRWAFVKKLKPGQKSERSLAEEAFWDAWQKNPLEGAELHREFEFDNNRKWRFDFAIPSLRIAIEIEGRGRHQTVIGARNDAEKYNAAHAHGWRLLRFMATDKRRADYWVTEVIALACGAGPESPETE